LPWLCCLGCCSRRGPSSAGGESNKELLSDLAANEYEPLPQARFGSEATAEARSTPAQIGLTSSSGTRAHAEAVKEGKAQSRGLSKSPSFIMPGSEVQASIARSLQAIGIRAVPDEPECVICLEPFNAENPIMPTLCDCGVNQTCFHYACLLSWREKAQDCPACRATLYYEEPEDQRRTAE